MTDNNSFSPSSDSDNSIQHPSLTRRQEYILQFIDEIGDTLDIVRHDINGLPSTTETERQYRQVIKHLWQALDMVVHLVTELDSNPLPLPHKSKPDEILDDFSSDDIPR